MIISYYFSDFLAKALWEIHYYQSAAMTEALLLPNHPFQCLVKDIDDEVWTASGLWWEGDAIYALQTCTEHVLVMIFEMTYYISIVLLTPRNKLAIHAKHETIMVKDMQLLRDLWQWIDPTSSIGADDADMVRQKRVWHAQEEGSLRLSSMRKMSLLELRWTIGWTIFNVDSGISVQSTTLVWVSRN